MLQFTLRTIFAAVILTSYGASAGTLTFQLIASYPKNPLGGPAGGLDPIGVAFDGTNIWYGSNADGLIREMSTSGMDTGRTTTNPLGVSGLAWSGSQLVAASATTISYFDRVTGTNRSDFPITAAVTGSGLGIGLDFDHNEIWYDRDRSNVFRLTPAGALGPGPNPVLGGPIGGSGAFSAVERIDVGGNSFLVVMTADFVLLPNVHKICQETLDGIELGCADFGLSRYRDFAFDGRFLYGASPGSIDKFDLIGPQGSILATPEPGGLVLLCTGLFGVCLLKRYGAAWRYRTLFHVQEDRVRTYSVPDPDHQRRRT